MAYRPDFYPYPRRRLPCSLSSSTVRRSNILLPGILLLAPKAISSFLLAGLLAKMPVPTGQRLLAEQLRLSTEVALELLRRRGPMPVQLQRSRAIRGSPQAEANSNRIDLPNRTPISCPCLCPCSMSPCRRSCLTSLGLCL